jgi:AcrR family transcriptional regulator
MKDRRDRILDVAVNLAEEGGFDNVRQRDVAADAGVALGTLYKSFRSKEDILSAALEREAVMLERRMEKHPTKGDTPLDRVCTLFQLMTRGLCRKPNYARAVLRAMTAGEPEVARNVAAYYGRVNRLVIAALVGDPGRPVLDSPLWPPSGRESTLAFFLQQVWFSSLVGWSAGLFDESVVMVQLRMAAKLLIQGTERDR